MPALYEAATAFLKATILESVTSLNVNSHSILTSLGGSSGNLAAAAVTAAQSTGDGIAGNAAVAAVAGGGGVDTSFLAATNVADGHESIAAWPSASMHYHGYKYSELSANQQASK